jgi:hypothetical protein
MMTGPVERPLLFLDVDGTLIPLGHAGHRAVGDSSGNPLLARLDPRHAPLLQALECELVWATSWMDDANTEISRRLGLPALPVVGLPDDTEYVVTGRVHWKTQTLVSWAAGRPFVWVDDEISRADRAWVASWHQGDALLHRVEPARGLTEADFAAIHRWLGRRHQ